ncbi:MAG: hypothetical protein GTN81_02225 [Proteobacteria bacterium]|nr:hypothetical protein [Pseudomonadota bacterium]
MIRESTPRSVACRKDYFSENFITTETGYGLSSRSRGIGDCQFDLGDFALGPPFREEQEAQIAQASCGEAIQSGDAALLRTGTGPSANPRGLSNKAQLRKGQNDYPEERKIERSS